MKYATARDSHQYKRDKVLISFKRSKFTQLVISITNKRTNCVQVSHWQHWQHWQHTGRKYCHLATAEEKIERKEKTTAASAGKMPNPKRDRICLSARSWWWDDDESELFSLTGGFKSQVFNCQSLRFVQIDMNCVIYHNLSHRQIILLSYDEAQEKKPVFVKNNLSFN